MTTMNSQTFAIAALGILVVPMIFVFAYVMSRLNFRMRERMQRLQVMQKALDKGVIGPTEKQVLIDGMAHEAPRWEEGALIRRYPIATVAWLGLFAGIGFLVSGERHLEEPGMILTVASFGLITLPLALREMVRRTA